MYEVTTNKPLTLTLTLPQLREIINDSIITATANIVSYLRPADDLISQNEMQRSYGKTREGVKRLIELGVKPIVLGNGANSKKYYSRAQIESIIACNGFLTDYAINLRKEINKRKFIPITESNGKKKAIKRNVISPTTKDA